MNRKEIIDALSGQGLSPEYHRDTKELMLSNKIVRCRHEDSSIVAIGADSKKDDPIHGFIDAVHYHVHTIGENGTLRYVIGRRTRQEEYIELLKSISLLLNSITIPLNVQIEVDFEPVGTVSVEFNDELKNRNWFKKIVESQGMALPPMANSILSAVNDDSFRWYRNVTGGNWSGRVEGLQVCSINVKGDLGTLDVGREGKQGDGPARQVFIEIAGDKIGDFTEHDIAGIVPVIRRLIESRKNGRLNLYQREHLLESRVLRSIAELTVDDKPLTPVITKQPFQFPTLWSPKGNPRFLDALMKDGDIPWAVELKEPKGSSTGQDYRHAITQSILYREFIKRATLMHEWFSSLGLDASQCHGAVAFPKMDNTAKQQKLLRQHHNVASAFGINVIEIDRWD